MKKALPFDKVKKLFVDPEVLFRRSAVPPSLFNADGSMRKKQSNLTFAKCSESHCEEVHQLPATDSTLKSTLYIIYGMAVVQSLNESQFQTFNDLGEVVIRKLLKIINDLTLSVSDVEIVLNRYDQDDSINAMEHSLS